MRSKETGVYVDGKIVGIFSGGKATSEATSPGAQRRSSHAGAWNIGDSVS
ncbi:hypothetical protein ACPOL_6144 [Acidisarcina polymorpha]|uniref:Uncharacterized protein n=1 Tax=Acidisarcina polymorpha TaxID=2211140 RepID=A0A2Z5G8U1_9BACT|nr:hypothetical protein ACPOL_6144 [Acidisarcina polymorpha]